MPQSFPLWYLEKHSFIVVLKMQNHLKRYDFSSGRAACQLPEDLFLTLLTVSIAE